FSVIRFGAVVCKKYVEIGNGGAAGQPPLLQQVTVAFAAGVSEGDVVCLTARGGGVRHAAQVDGHKNAPVHGRDRRGRGLTESRVGGLQEQLVGNGRISTEIALQLRRESPDESISQGGFQYLCVGRLPRKAGGQRKGARLQAVTFHIFLLVERDAGYIG